MKTKKIFSLAIVAGLSFVRVCAQEINDTLNDVVVTGTGTNRLLRNAPVQTEVISRQMLDSYGGKSIEEILGGLTSSFAFSEGDMGSQMQLGGLGNSYILILIDGKRIHGDNGGENDLGLIDPQNIDHIEIVKGAQSALYGSDAMAGVINIITRRAKVFNELKNTSGLFFDESTRAESGGGLKYDIRQHNSLGLKLSKLQSFTNFSYQYNDGWQNTSDAYTEGKLVHDALRRTVNKYDNFQIAERVSYAFSKHLDVYAEGSWYNKTITRLSPYTEGLKWTCDKYTYNLHYKNASASVGGKWMWNKNEFLNFDIDWNKHAYYYKYTARTYEYVKLTGSEYGDQEGELWSVPMYEGQSRLQSDQQRLTAQLKTVFVLPYRNTINAGLEYRYDYLKAPDRTDTGTAHDWTGALYIQDEYDFLNWLNITAGLRLVDNGNFGFRMTPKLSTMLLFGDFRVRLGWSQGFKTPTVKELNYRYLHVMGSSTFFYLGNKSLDPQSSNYWSANVEYRGKRLTASVTGYYNSLDNMIALINVPVSEIPVGITTAYLGDGSNDVVTRMYKNMEDAKTYGLDINLSYKILEGLSFTGSYSYLDTDAHVYNTSSNNLVKTVIDGMAHHKWSAGLSYNHRFAAVYRLGANLSTRGSSKRYYQNNGDGKAFQLWRLSTTHDLGHADRLLSYRIELGVDNIFNYVDRTPYDYHLGTTAHGTSIYGSFILKLNYGKKVSATLKKHSFSDEE